MTISIMVAMTREGAIGLAGHLPWYLPADLQWFKKQTLGKPVIMGRKTFESLKAPLKDRLNIVLSHSPKVSSDNVRFVTSKEAALAAAAPAQECMVIGGSSIYQAFLAKANKLYITWIEQAFSGDTFFPAWDQNAWSLSWEEHHEPDKKNACAYTFTWYEKR